MITDATVIHLCAAIYGTNNGVAYPDPRTTFDIYEDGTLTNGVVYGIKIVDGVAVVIFRGSVSELDWIRDFDARARIVDPRLGMVHPGFNVDMYLVWVFIQKQLPARMPTIIGGHSLGAARAGIITGYMVLDKRPPIKRVVCGEPKPGFQQLADIVATVPGVSYFNHSTGRDHDRVVDIPFSIPPENFVRSTPLVGISVAPSGNVIETHGMFSWHHAPLYDLGVESIPNQQEITS